MLFGRRPIADALQRFSVRLAVTAMLALRQIGQRMGAHQRPARKRQRRTNINRGERTASTSAAAMISNARFAMSGKPSGLKAAIDRSLQRT